VERDRVLTELTGATGLAGRTRRFPDEAERARISVGKAIRRVLVKVAQADPALGEHLRDTVRTGMFCVYRPRGNGPFRPVERYGTPTGVTRGYAAL